MGTPPGSGPWPPSRSDPARSCTLTPPLLDVGHLLPAQGELGTRRAGGVDEAGRRHQDPGAEAHEPPVLREGDLGDDPVRLGVGGTGMRGERDVHDRPDARAHQVHGRDAEPDLVVADREDPGHRREEEGPLDRRPGDGADDLPVDRDVPRADALSWGADQAQSLGCRPGSIGSPPSRPLASPTWQISSAWATTAPSRSPTSPSSPSSRATAPASTSGRPPSWSSMRPPPSTGTPSPGRRSWPGRRRSTRPATGCPTRRSRRSAAT